MGSSSRRAAVLFVAVAALGSSPPLWAVCDHVPAPVAQELPAAPDYTTSRPRHIDAWGHIAGQVSRPSPQPVVLAAVWKKTRNAYAPAELLPQPEDLASCEARGFVRGHRPIGYCSVASGRRAVLWQKEPTGIVALELPAPENLPDTMAFAASPMGVIVGEASDTKAGVRHAVAWLPHRDGSYETCDLGVPADYLVSNATDVNDFGWIAGTARRFETLEDGRQRTRVDVIVWRPVHREGPCVYKATALPGPSDMPVSQQPAINEIGDVVARADRVVTGQMTTAQALVWLRSVRGWSAAAALPAPEGFTDAFARDITTSRQILGTARVRPTSTTVSASKAVVWKRSRGVWTPQPLDSPENALVSAEQMNERGDVIATATGLPEGSTGALVWPKPRFHWFFGELAQSYWNADDWFQMPLFDVAPMESLVEPAITPEPAPEQAAEPPAEP